MDQFFDNLDELLQDELHKDELIQGKDTHKTSCCDDVKNHLRLQGVITCSVCSNTVTNIVNNPEWRYYGSNDTKSSDPTRCGMPVNKLLPEASCWNKYIL